MLWRYYTLEKSGEKCKRLTSSQSWSIRRVLSRDCKEKKTRINSVYIFICTSNILPSSSLSLFYHHHLNTTRKAKEERRKKSWKTDAEKNAKSIFDKPIILEKHKCVYIRFKVHKLENKKKSSFWSWIFLFFYSSVEGKCETAWISYEES